ncbi:MAG: tetratricopeptide repeat protein, partial [Nostocaceae cyanobacterium]|nr:tetratricopeptide repeat protein [Nostocaceae cyanobacterium]
HDDYPEQNLLKNPYLTESKYQLNQQLNIHPHQEYVNPQSNAPVNLEDYQKKPELFQLNNEMNDNNPDAYKNRANFRYDLGDYEGAIQDYTQAININPQDADAYYNRGNVSADTGNYEGAIQDYTQAININANDAEAYYNRANLRTELGDKQGGIADFQKACELYRQTGKLAEHKKVRERILDLEIEASLDILNF